MHSKVEERVDNLERAALEFEGAQFATRHLLAMLLSRLDRHEAEEYFRDLQCTGRKHVVELGKARLTGYLDELEAVRHAACLARTQPVTPLRVVL